MAKKTHEVSKLTTFVDPETGEIKEITQSKVYVKNIETDKFYMTFIDYISPLYQIKSETTKSILVWMCCHAEWNTGEVKLSTATRKQLCEELNISSNTLTNNLAILKKLKIVSGEKGDFLINPQIHWKGDNKTRSQLLQKNEIKITFSIE